MEEAEADRQVELLECSTAVDSHLAIGEMVVTKQRIIEEMQIGQVLMNECRAVSKMETMKKQLEVLGKRNQQSLFTVALLSFIMKFKLLSPKQLKNEQKFHQAEIIKLLLQYFKLRTELYFEEINIHPFCSQAICYLTYSWFSKSAPSLVCSQHWTYRRSRRERNKGLGLKGGTPPSSPRKESFAPSGSSSEDEDAVAPAPCLQCMESGLFARSESSSDASEDDPCTSTSVQIVTSDQNFTSNVLPTMLVPNQPKIKIKRVKCDCEKNCNEAANLLEVSGDLEILKTKFVGTSLTETKNNLLKHLKTQGDFFQTNQQGFFYKGHDFCTGAFSSMTGISNYILRKVLDSNLRGVESFTHGNTDAPKNSINKNNAVAWFKAFCDLYCQQSPDKLMVVCPSFLTVTTLYKMYQSETSIELEQIAYSTFCEMIRSDFGPKRKFKHLPWVRFSKHSSHSVCDTCSDLDKFRRTCRSQKDIDLCQALVYKHKERFGNQRMCISNLRHLSQTLPDQFFSIFIDGMDNMKSNLPRFEEKTKKLANFFKLPSKVTGALVYSSRYPLRRKVKMLVNFDHFEQGKCSLLFH